MEVANNKINIPIDFNQVVEIIKQLPYNEILKLSEVLRMEAEHKKKNDEILTYFASEKVLAKDSVT
ncbi:MAG: hypothetical protein JEY97_08560 [Bacteroidales bacterium]|nr:hypothetical protein [Bacteroidales bacterium]